MKFVFLILSFVLISCSSSYEQTTNDDSQTTSASLTNTKWVLRVLNDKKIYTPEGGKEIYLVLTSEFNKVNGTGGCNSFSTTYTAMGKKLIFGNVASTEMFCENKMDTEGAFFKALGNTVRYRIKGNNLYFYDAEKVIAKFQATDSE